MSESGDVAAWSRQTLDKTLADRVHDLHEHERNGARRLSEGPQDRSGSAEDHIRCLAHHLYGVRAHAVCVATGPVVVDPKVAALRPSKILKPPPEDGDAGLCFRDRSRRVNARTRRAASARAVARAHRVATRRPPRLRTR